jgi:phage baseplate assembly protein W
MTSLPPPPAPPGAPPGDDSAVRRRALLGIGVRADLVSTIDTARDLVLRTAATGVDLALVDGVDTLDQDLAIGLTTLRGSDPFNLQFGFLGLRPLVDQTSPVLAREALRAAVVQLVAADPRVRRVVDATVSPPHKASRVMNVTVTFESVTGDPVTVDTGGLASGAAFGVLNTPGVNLVVTP